MYFRTNTLQVWQDTDPEGDGVEALVADIDCKQKARVPGRAAAHTRLHMHMHAAWRD